MKKKTNIVQWNCRGLNQVKKNELETIITEKEAQIVCIQETKFGSNQTFQKKHFNCFQENFKSIGTAKGGVLIMIKENISCHRIKIKTKLQAVAVKVYFPEEISICNIYVPPREKICKSTLRDLINQLGEKFMLLGDFNAKSLLWGSPTTDEKGAVWEEIIEEMGLNVLNSGKPTHLNCSHKTYSHIDVTLMTNNATNQFTWETIDDLHSSDHFPITISTDIDNTTAMRPKWKMKEANWENFRENLKWDAEKSENTTINDLERKIREIILKAASKSIGKTTGNRSKKYNPWWTQEIENLVKEKKRLFRIFKRSGSNRDFNLYISKQKEANKKLKIAKQSSWENFVGETNSQNSTTELYNKVRKLTGKFKSNQLTSIEISNEIIYDKQKIVEELANKFNKITSIENYAKETRDLMEHEDKEQIEIEEDIDEIYNWDFTMEELKTALRKCKGTTPGPDEIHYEMIKNSTDETKEVILKLYNRLWRNCEFPDNWRNAIAIPVRKPGKDPKKPENLRTIQLTNVMCKIMERMVNNRLTWWIEENKIINERQSGFRRQRRTLDGLLDLENDITRAINNRTETLLISFDLEKAYDTTRRRPILEKLKSKGLKGNIMYFINNMLKDRKVCTQMGNTKSKQHIQETGLIQGSVLSVTLFLLAVDELLNVEQKEIKAFMYADDLIFYVNGDNREKTCKIMQKAIEKACKITKSIGCKFSPEKTVGIWFNNKNKTEVSTNLKCNGKLIQMVQQHKILGLTFDRKLTWKSHTKDLKARAEKKLNIIKMLSNHNYGLKYNKLLILHESIILSTLDYGAPLYGSASEATLSKLDSIHHNGLRIATGIFKTCPVQNLLIESGFLPLNMRRKLQIALYGNAIKNNKTHPARSELIQYKKPRNINNLRKPFYERFNEIRQEIGMKWDKSEIKNTTPWTKVPIKTNCELTRFSKNNNPNIIFKIWLRELLEKYKNHTIIFTDGSKANDKVGWGFTAEKKDKFGKLPAETSIYTAELHAILKALEWAAQEKIKQIVICTDSLAALKGLENNISKQKIVNQTQELVTKENFDVTIIWVPGHVGIKKNEKADNLAKLGSEQGTLEKTYISKMDEDNMIKQSIWEIWGKKIEANEVLYMKGHMQKDKKLSTLSRKEAIIFMRLRTKHTRLTHSHLFEKKPQPRCECGEIQNVDHLLGCKRWKTLRERLKLDNHTALIGTKNAKKVLKYLKERNLFHEI